MQNAIIEHEGCLKAVIRVRNELGLHARPAARLAQEAQKFTCELRLEASGLEVDAKSILDILSLAASRGTELTIKGWGDDAPQALEHMLQVLAGILGEGA